MLDGGEPTVHPALNGIIRAALSIGYGEVNIVTNGVRLAGAGLAAGLAAVSSPAGQKVSFSVSLHSDKPEISDALTGMKGGFVRTTGAIKKLFKAGFKKVSVYHVITSSNYRRLDKFAAYLLAGFPEVRTVTFSHIFPSGRAVDNFRIYPRLSAVEPFFSKAAARLQGAGVKVELSGCGMIPLCLLDGQTLLAAKQFKGANQDNTAVYDSNKDEPFLLSSDQFNLTNKTKGPFCRKCVLDRICGGIWKLYASRRGLSELKPILRLKGIRPGGGTAEISASPGRNAKRLSSQELCIRLFELRLSGCSRVKIPAACLPRKEELDRAIAFAKGIGLKVILPPPAQKRPRR